eukprot:TRINITY_DN3837_c1_g3_i2.p2 TRINITY_DN3837_c1_g3~~TRINITY_DN3837_c1_g3_i2.p2  ORF type:complete len:546 (+),score=156.64 TRINITY_DN3837_c1_g3_i2:2598-4235(+)
MINLNSVRTIEDARRLAVELLRKDQQLVASREDANRAVSPRRAQRAPLIAGGDFRQAVDYVLQPWGGGGGGGATVTDQEGLIVKEKMVRMQSLQEQKKDVETERDELRKEIERITAVNRKLREELGPFASNELVQVVRPQQEVPPPPPPRLPPSFGTWQEIERIATGGNPVTVGRHQPLPIPRYVDTGPLIVNMPPPPLAHPPGRVSPPVPQLSPRAPSHSPWITSAGPVVSQPHNSFRPVAPELMSMQQSGNRQVSPNRERSMQPPNVVPPVGFDQSRQVPIPMPQPSSSLDQQVVDELRKLREELKSTKQEVEELRRERQDPRPEEVPPKPEPPPTPTPFSVSVSQTNSSKAPTNTLSEPPYSKYAEEKIRKEQEQQDQQQKQGSDPPGPVEQKSERGEEQAKQSAAARREQDNPSPSWASEDALLSEVDEFVRNLESSKPSFAKNKSLPKADSDQPSSTPIPAALQPSSQVIAKASSGPGGISISPASLPQPMDQSPARFGGGWSAPGSTKLFRSNTDILKLAESGIEGAVRPMPTPTADKN